MASRKITIPLVVAGALVAIYAVLYAAGSWIGAPDARQLYRVCIDGDWPDEDDARQRSDACSQALQARRLRPDEVALARLTRGVARTMLGNIVASNEDYLEALKHYDGTIDPAHPDSLDILRRAIAEHGLGQTDRALADYDDAIRRDPKNHAAYLQRGILLATRARNFRRAIGDFNRALELEPRNFHALIARGEAWSQLGEFGPALSDLDQAIKLAPTHPHALIVRGLVHAREGKPQLALQDYDAALKITDREPFALMSRAALNAADGNYGPAIRDLDASLAINDTNALAFYNRGVARFALGDHATAIADYDAALKLDGDMGLAHLNRCLTRVLAGTAGKDDVAGCDTALKLMPLSLDVRETRGFAFLKLREPSKALAEYETVLAIDANRAQALYGRGLAECRLARDADCRKDKAAALALDPGVEQQFKRYGID
ncbi:MAG TPA: tetratricopeptide repeat protein [Xanthobacteraceae bacterium]|nr:tetratricopeptide repeat protein [Xanthobacteraceae bacterium]